jgi:alpha-galactosidase
MRRALAMFLLAGGVHGLDNGLGLLPLRGISSWCVQGQCGWDRCWDSQYRSLADAMVDEGFLAAGYEYALIDDCWVAGRDNTTQELYADPTRFPDGIEAVATYFHSRGLKVCCTFAKPTDACACWRVLDRLRSRCVCLRARARGRVLCV